MFACFSSIVWGEFDFLYFKKGTFKFVNLFKIYTDKTNKKQYFKINESNILNSQLSVISQWHAKKTKNKMVSSYRHRVYTRQYITQLEINRALLKVYGIYYHILSPTSLQSVRINVYDLYSCNFRNFPIKPIVQPS